MYGVPGSGSESPFFKVPDPHFDLDPKFSFYFFHVKTLIFGKNQAPAPYPQIFQTPDPQIFQTLNPQTHEMDADPKPWYFVNLFIGVLKLAFIFLCCAGKLQWTEMQTTHKKRRSVKPDLPPPWTKQDNLGGI